MKCFASSFDIAAEMSVAAKSDVARRMDISARRMGRGSGRMSILRLFSAGFDACSVRCSLFRMAATLAVIILRWVEVVGEGVLGAVVVR